MKILVVGDPHGYKNIKDVQVDENIDLILITGDLAESDMIRSFYFKAKEKGVKDWKKEFSKEELDLLYTNFINSAIDVLEYFNQFNKPVYFVYGNLFGMDYCIMEKYINRYNLTVPDFEFEIKKFKNVENIGLNIVKFKGVKIIGIPYFDSCEWINRFNSKEEDRIQFAKKQEPIIHQLLCNNSDIVLSHLPPFGVLDKVTSEFAPESWINKNAGNKMIIDYIQNFKPKYVFCGHIHEGYGQEKVENTIVCNMGLAKYKVIDI